MDLRDEIVARLDELPPDLYGQVLQFMNSLAQPELRGESGAGLLPFAGSLDPDSAEEMLRAIEEDCERIDAAEW